MKSREDAPCLPGYFRVRVNPEDKTRHISGKPVRLIEQMLPMVPPGGTVLDLFAGGWSTGIAAVKNGFRFIGIEGDPTIFDSGDGLLERYGTT